MKHGQQRPDASPAPTRTGTASTTNYCNGVTADDVVAHEWGHAYTEFTHGLIYQWQPGALNESYSDIWGETVDLINGRMDDDEGDIETKRPDGQCSDVHPRRDLRWSSTRRRRPPGPAPPAPAVLRPGASTATGVTADVVVGQDAANAAGPGHDRRLHARSPTRPPWPATFVYVDRGTCAFAGQGGQRRSRRRRRASSSVTTSRRRAPISMSGTADDLRSRWSRSRRTARRDQGLARHRQRHDQGRGQVRWPTPSAG